MGLYSLGGSIEIDTSLSIYGSYLHARVVIPSPGTRDTYRLVLNFRFTIHVLKGKLAHNFMTSHLVFIS